MNGKPRAIILDTNVWLDYFLPWRKGADAAKELIALAITRDIALLYPIHALKDAFYLIAESIKRKTREDTGDLTESQALAARQIAWGCAENIRQNATAIGADEADAWLAFKYRPLNDDLEDNLVLAAAHRARADFLVTSDAALLKKATVEAHAPEDAIVLLKLSE